jgi:Holliday junction resolvasome RuvABC endonuclease subunit
MKAENRLKKDFKLFLYLIYKHLNLPDPTPVQYDMADFLQSDNKKICIEAFRGIGKSWITSAYVLWRLYTDPQVKIMVVSANSDRAKQFTTFTRRLIEEVTILQHLIPTDKQRDSVEAFDVKQATADQTPSVKSVGIFGQMTGSRADLIIADDVEVPKNSETQTQREKLLERTKEFSAVLKPLKSSKVIYLGTPQTEESIYSLLPDRGFVIRIWPARYPTEKKIKDYSNRLAPFILRRLDQGLNASGDAVEPKRFPEEILADKELEYGRAGFSLQFMLDTTLSDADKYPLKLADLVVTDLDSEKAPASLLWSNSTKHKIDNLQNLGFNGDAFFEPQFTSPELVKYQGSIMAIDPSGRGKDKTGYAVVKIINGMQFLTSCGGISGGYEESTLTKLAQIAEEHKVNKVIIEANFGDGMYTEIFKPVLNNIYPCSIEEVKHSTQKEARIVDTLEPVISKHKLIVDRKVVASDYNSNLSYGDNSKLHKLFYQLTHITKERGALKHDDLLDALAMAVAYWSESMGVDTEKMSSRIKEERRVAAVMAHYKKIDKKYGRSSEVRTWGGRW